MVCRFCQRPPIAREMCGIHYQRWKRTGNPEASQAGKRTDVKPIEYRIADSYLVLESGCWEWALGVNKYGYGKIKHEGRTRGAHVVSWFLANGQWPKEELDHLCHTLDKDCSGGVTCRHRRCINPSHLEEVSKVENTRRRDTRRRL
jgi:hypothetical protein